MLVTGFEPFGGSTLNPSQLIVETLSQRVSANDADAPACDLHTALLPVDTGRLPGVLDALWDRYAPDIVLHFGESARADRFTIERVAINLLDFDEPDNTGTHLTEQPIDPQGPAARFATLHVRALRDRLNDADTPARLSLSAGAYLCNQALYHSLGLAERRPGAAVGFVHVPSLADQVARGERPGPGMDARRLLDGARRLIDLAVALHLTEPM